jgi:transcriptional regulator with PAS, ATPase and Fis domain
MNLHLAKKTRRNAVKQAVVGAVRESLTRNGGNVREAADELGIPYRTLHRWITDLGLRRELDKLRRQAAA